MTTAGPEGKKRRDPDIAAKYGGAEEFFSVYQPKFARGWTDSRGDTLLHAALSHNSHVDRASMANRLLDDGADASALTNAGWSCAHIHLSRIDIDDPRDDLNVPLLLRLFEAGCDVNYVHPQEGTALLSLAARCRFSDEQLRPYYAEFFARPELDLLAITTNGGSDLDTIRRWAGERQGLLGLMEQHLRQQGIAIPVGSVFELASWADTDRILKAYQSTDALAVDPKTGRTLLHIVLDHSGLSTRLAVANRLLDDGADPRATTTEGLTPAHILLKGHGQRDPAQEAVLLERLLRDADVNAVAKAGVGTPLVCLSKMTNMSEESRAPLYEVLLNHPDLDPFTKVGRTKTVMDLLSKSWTTETLRAQLAERFPAVGKR